MPEQVTESTSSSRSGSRWKWVALGLSVMLVGLIVWDGADRRAADATEPLPQSPATSVRNPPPSSLKIASFNIHTGKGTDGVRSLSRIADLLSDVDFAGLYEVRGAAGRNEPNQAASLANLYQGGWLFAATERRWWSDHFGNGLLYRIPVRAALRVPLINTRGKAYRNAILATVELEQANVRVLAVHIDRENDRRPQLQAMIDLFLSLQEPCVLMGDLNTTAEDPLLSNLMERPGVRSPLHESLVDRLPSQNIDWIFTRGLNTVVVNLVENTASDHPVVTAELSPGSTAKSTDANQP